jgi:hypothetical protein
MATKYTNIFHCKTVRNLPKSGFLAIWQPWLAGWPCQGHMTQRATGMKGKRKLLKERKKEMERKRNNSLSAKTFSGSSGTDVMIFKKYFRKKIVVKIGVFDLKQRAKLWKKLIITLVLEKNANFFA